MKLQTLVSLSAFAILLFAVGFIPLMNQYAFAAVTSVAIEEPEADTSFGANFSIDYTVSDNLGNTATAGTITFTRTGGSPDAGTHIYTMAVPADTSTGEHTISRTILEADAGFDALVDGSEYTIDISITDGVAFTDQELIVTADFTSPSFSAAKTASNQITLTWDENVNSVLDTATAGNPFTLGGTALTVSSTSALNGASNTQTLTLSGVIADGSSITVSYDKDAVNGDITDAVTTDPNEAPDINNIDVSGIPQPPVVTITAPADSSSFGIGDSILFTGTATDLEDGDISASLSWSSDIDGVIGSGASFSTSSLSVGVHTITASVTDSDTNPGSDSITFKFNNRGDGCDTECTPPTLGVDKNGKRLVENGFTYNENSINVELFFTPYPLIKVNVGEENRADFKIYENMGPEKIKHFSFAFGLGQDQVISQSKAMIELDIDFDGKEIVTVTDPENVLEDVRVETSHVSCDGDKRVNCLGVTIFHTFRAPLDFNMVATDVWDIKRNAWQNYYNHGIEVIGKSLNPPKEYDGINRGQIYHLTETSKTTAVDEFGNFWTLKYDKWYKDYVVKKVQDTGNVKNRNHSAFSDWKQLQAETAVSYFDSSKIQSTVDDPFTYEHLTISHREQTLQTLYWHDAK